MLLMDGGIPIIYQDHYRDGKLETLVRITLESGFRSNNVKFSKVNQIHVSTSTNRETYCKIVICET